MKFIRRSPCCELGMLAWVLVGILGVMLVHAVQVQHTLLRQRQSARSQLTALHVAAAMQTGQYLHTINTLQTKLRDANLALSTTIMIACHSTGQTDCLHSGE
ncbi:MAG: hypothetical protein ACYCOR_13515 [Acidobacteriaceae bacterium]